MCYAIIYSMQSISLDIQHLILGLGNSCSPPDGQQKEYNIRKNIMNILNNIKKTAENDGDRLVFHSRDGSITYRELWEQSGRLAAWLNEHADADRRPVPVYGHKSPFMLVCFLACTRSGRAYCPLDINMPQERIDEIIQTVGSRFVLATRPLVTGQADVIGPDEIREISLRGVKSGEGAEAPADIDEKYSNKPEDIHYIIFTSGSTGKPKGVRITTGNLNAYLDWSRTLVGDKSGVFLNQAPFSFDLSVMDLYTGLATGSAIYAADEALQQDVPKLMDYLKEGDLQYWVSTPSFADVCLSDPSFNRDSFPALEAFLFCGETLTKRTAGKLMERFPDAAVINTYGPTECTVCVTSVRVTEELMADDRPLPIGRAKPGTEFYIMREDGSFAGAGETGELIITGDTVSPGYFRNPEKTAEVFGEIEPDSAGRKIYAYKTGDSGYKEADGMLYYAGRIDHQIKLHGYRIELGDIEANLLKISEITGAAVIPEKNEDGTVKHLAAFVVPSAESRMTDCYENRKKIRTGLKDMLPSYMVPKKVRFIDEMPLTANGKIDRKKLGELL